MNKSPDSNNQEKNETDIKSNADRPPNAPRWVKVSGIIIIILVLLFIILKFTGIGGDHGPGRHGFSDQSAEQIQQMLFIRDMPLAYASTVGFSG